MRKYAEKLKDLKTPEERLESWNEFLPMLFDMEEELLMLAIQIKSRASNADSDQEKKELLIEICSQVENARAKTKVLQDLQERLNDPLNYIINHIGTIRNSMTNIFYGYAADGSEVWSDGKPK